MKRNLLGPKQMITRNTSTCLLCLFVLFGVDTIWADVPAFPGAEGYGAATTGGRGGAVYEVTNLNSSGSGSFGAAIGASGARTVVFRVSGTITGNFSINNDDITIAGQTAPGDGICIKGMFYVGADNVIIRYIRIRWDPSQGESDAIWGRYNSDIIVDHVSASWSTDEVMSLYMNENVTIQWCMITEACEKGDTGSHRFGGIWGNNYCTMHHNLFAHNESRNPRFASGCGYNDYRNNVIYNWDYQSCYGGEKSQTSSDFGFTTINMIANYYKYGPATDEAVKRRIAEPSARSSDDKGDWYVADNFVVGYPAVTADNWLGVDGSNYIQLNEPWPAMVFNQQTAEDAYNAVLNGVGCSFPNRDAVDARIIEEVRNGTATYGNNGIIDSPSDVGGWPTLATGTPPTDSDHDGMPDDWETANGLNPADAADRNYYTLSTDYTNLEVYLNSLVNTVDTTPPSPDPMTWEEVPHSIGGVDIAMEATTATDTSGVQYYFANLTDPNHNSGWVSSPSWTDTDLETSTTYSYSVMARDNSPNENETGWSDVNSATTDPWACTAPIDVDLSGDCLVNMIDYAILAAAWTGGPYIPELIINGGFDTDISSWSLVSLSGATGVMTAVFDGAAGNPPGSALVEADTGTTGANNHRFYQVIPVTVGKEYVFNGDWAGDISGTIATNPDARNWAEVFIGFTDTTIPDDADFGSIIYKKAYGNGNQNTSTGVWDWEPITESPNGSSAPEGGVFVATEPYMCVSFNLGGRANSGSTYFWVDNISVTENSPCAEIDLNDDCELNFQDLAIFVEDWLLCNRDPATECWQ